MTRMLYGVLLTADGDLPSFTRMGRGRDLIAQRAKTRVGTHLGEWFIDTAAGLPWQEWASAKPVPTSVISARVRSVVANTPGVTGIRTWEATFDQTTKTVTINGQIDTQAGELAMAVSAFGVDGPNRTYEVLFY